MASLVCHWTRIVLNVGLTSLMRVVMTWLYGTAFGLVEAIGTAASAAFWKVLMGCCPARFGLVAGVEIS